MDNMQRRLEEARTELRHVQWQLNRLRQLGCEDRPSIVQRFYTALDRAWEAQCMAQGSL